LCGVCIVTSPVELSERRGGDQDRIEIRRLARGRISARWCKGRVLHDAVLVAEERLVGLLLSWPRARLSLHRTIIGARWCLPLFEHVC
jgi:hypothetical protein